MMRAQRGFTFIELLIAVTILAVITGLVYASFVGVTSSMEEARASAEALRFRQFLSRTLHETLGAVYIDAGCLIEAYRFEGVDESGPYGPLDSLRFCTSLPMSGATAVPGVLRVVEIVDGDEADEDLDPSAERFNIDAPYTEELPHAMLAIRETPLIVEEADFDSFDDELEENGRTRFVPVRSFDVTYYDQQNEEWVDEWNSMDLVALPWMVRIRIVLARDEDTLDDASDLGIDAAREPDLDIVLPLWTGMGATQPFIDFNHIRVDETGAFVGGDDLFAG